MIVDAIKSLLSSKKFLVMLSGQIALIASKFTWASDLSPEVVLGFMTALLTVFGISQGVADHGKEKAIVEASASKQD